MSEAWKRSLCPKRKRGWGVHLSICEDGRAFLQAPAAAALPSPTPLIYAVRRSRPLTGPPPGSSFVPRQIPNGRQPLGRKGPSLAVVRSPGGAPMLTKAAAPNPPCWQLPLCPQLSV